MSVEHILDLPAGFVLVRDEVGRWWHGVEDSLNGLDPDSVQAKFLDVAYLGEAGFAHPKAWRVKQVASHA